MADLTLTLTHTHTDGADVLAHWSGFVATASDLPFFVYSSPMSAHSKTKLMNSSSSSNLTKTSKTALCFVSWKHGLTHPSLTVQPPGYTLFQADRSPDLSNKLRNGEISFLVNQRWCSDADVLSTSCSPET